MLQLRCDVLAVLDAGGLGRVGGADAGLGADGGSLGADGLDGGAQPVPGLVRVLQGGLPGGGGIGRHGIPGPVGGVLG
ncbi:hypothetical protein GCM10025734_45280 [Kitasatospora paranensis]